MLTYEQALAKIHGSVKPLESTYTLVADSLGRLLHEEIVSTIDLPTFDNSQMDGYAVNARDTQTATSAEPVTLTVIGEIQAGDIRKTRSIELGQCVRIFTGAPMPRSLDSVIPQEDVTIDGSKILLHEPAESGQFIRYAGDDIKAGEIVVERGAKIRSYEIAMISSVGIDTVSLSALPRIALICTGNELVRPGSGALQPGQIYNSSMPTIAAQISLTGGRVVFESIARDTEAEMVDVLQSALVSKPDLIIVCGGVSVGKYDCVRPAILSMDGTLDFTSVAIRPGKPTTFGFLSGIPIFGLPGNPVSAMVTFELFVRPAILRLAGYPVERCSRPLIDAVLTASVSHEPSRQSFARAVVEFVDATIRVTPGDHQRSDQVSGMVSANALLVISDNIMTLPAQSKVKVMLID